MRLPTLALAVVSLALSFNASAADIQLIGGTFTANVLFSPDFSTVLATDFRSDATFLYNNPGPIGTVLTGDFGSPIPNNVILAVNPGVTEGGTLTLFGGLALFSPDKQLMFVPVVGTPITAITLPEVAAMLSVTGANYALLGVTELGEGNLASYGLTSLVLPVEAVPEPTAASLLALGLGGLYFLKMRLRS
jgi:hypothetical protein